MLEILALPVFKRALAALLLSGVAYPAMGTFILALELVPARFAVMHASLLGAAIGLLIGFDPTISAIIAAFAAGIAVARMGETAPKNDVSGGRAESASGALGLVMALSLAFAFIIFHKGKVHAIEAFNLFWGNVLALRPLDLWLTAATCAAIVAFALLFFKEIRAVLYDRELARSSGMPARAIHYALMVVVCLGLGMAMRLTGALLADALTIIPALAARNLRRGLKATLAWGAVFGVASNLGGFGLALAFDLPTGPAIIVAASIIAGATYIVGRRRA